MNKKAFKYSVHVAALLVCAFSFAGCARDVVHGSSEGSLRLENPAPAAGAAGLVVQAAAVKLEELDEQFLFADGSAQYVNPQEPTPDQPVQVKIRVGKNQAASVLLHYGANAWSIVNMVKVTPSKTENFGDFDYYLGEIPPSAQATYYYFEVKGSTTFFYSRKGPELKAPRNSYQFRVVPGASVPAWMKGAVLYQIYTDRFYNGDPTNDVVDNEYMYDNWPAVQVKDWNQLPDAGRSYNSGSNRTREFFGGDLEGVIQKLPYLKDLGIDGIYFNPLFVSPSNHKYDAQDYENIDPHFGVIVKDTAPGVGLIDPTADPNYKSTNYSVASTVNKTALKYITRTTSPENLAASNAKMKELVDKAHALGIKVIMDGVFNHSGSFNKWLDRESIYPDSMGPGAYESKSSPFAGYYKFTNTADSAWPSNETYDAWAGFKTLPKLYYENSKSLTDTILGIAAMWPGKYGTDGWRLDVATDLGYSPKYNHQFWQQFRTSVKTANPNAVILAEVYGDSSSWLGGNEWDTIMNYDAFFEPVSWFFTGLEKHSYAFNKTVFNKSNVFESTIREKMAKMPYESLEISMNELSNHDHSRFLTRTSGFVDGDRSTNDYSDQAKASQNIIPGIMKEAVAFQMTFPGAPTIYYGDEAGVAGFTDPDDRRTYPWGKEDKEMISVHKDLIQIHKQYSALKTGSFQSLSFFRDGEYAFARWDANSRVITVFNNKKTAATINVPLKMIDYKNGESFKVVFQADNKAHSAPNSVIKVVEDTLAVPVPAYGTVILVGAGAREASLKVAARPTVKGVFPAPGAKAVVVDATHPIRIEFSSSMEQRGIAEAFSIEPAVAGTFVWNGSMVNFVPSEALAAKTTYHVGLSPNVLRSVDGNFLFADAVSWEFTTK